MGTSDQNREAASRVLSAVRLINAHGRVQGDLLHVVEQALAVQHVAIQVTSDGRVNNSNKSYRQFQLTIPIAEVQSAKQAPDPSGQFGGCVVEFRFKQPILCKSYLYIVGSESLDTPPRWKESAVDICTLHVDSSKVADEIAELVLTARELLEGHEATASPGGTPLPIQPEMRIVEEPD